jgi:nitrous oxide reductase accessory protein NosL
MKLFKYFLVLSFLILVFNSCEKKDNSIMKKVHFDRDMCELCKMVISERNFAVQVVNPKNGKGYMFDDIGCAILWFKDEKISWEKDAKVYIADIKSKKFIDAKKAFYDTNSRTPMNYGFGAYESRANIGNKKMIIDFKETRLRILRGETMQNSQIKKGNL